LAAKREGEDAIYEVTFESVSHEERRGPPDTRVLRARLFVWSCEDQVVISDVDGTLTKSDVMGHYHTTLDTNFGYTRKLALRLVVLCDIAVFDLTIALM
jgi:hypothetical protein